MCETDVRYNSPLSLLKNCDANALGKLCETVTSMTDDPVAYANFPKRSLVKCFSARDKYEWHLSLTAELQDMEKKWTKIKQKLEKKPKRHHGISSASPANKRKSKGMREGRSIMAVRQSPSPMVANDDILREALMVAEHFEGSEESDMTSALSSDQKSPEEIEIEPVKPPRNTKPKPARGPAAITIPKQKQTSHIFPSPTARSSRPQPSHGLSNANRKVRKASPIIGRGTSSGNRQEAKDRPRILKRSTASPLRRNARTPKERSLRGSFGGCLGSKHSSVDLSSPHRSVDLTRRASTGPASRRMFSTNRLKSSGSCRLDRNSGSFGGSMKLHGSRPWK